MKRPLVATAVAQAFATTGTRHARRPLVATAVARLLARFTANPCHMVLADNA